MMTKVKPPQDEKVSLQKKIEEYTQYQWLALIPIWLPGILSLIHRTPTVPGREMYVLLFRIGMIIFGIICFVMVRRQIKKLKVQLAQIEAPPSIVAGPPIPDPRNP
jgi:hypothetical protein